MQKLVSCCMMHSTYSYSVSCISGILHSSVTQVIYNPLLIFLVLTGPSQTLGSDGACGLGWGQTDKEIGHTVYVIPPKASWYGSDMTLAIMLNVFIGNPASTFSTFVAKARLSLGFGHNYSSRAKDENGEWRAICGGNFVCLTKLAWVPWCDAPHC